MDLTLVPRDNLYRGLLEAPRLLTRAADDGTESSLMVGHFSVFNTWTEIHSWFEGDFMERMAPGAFAKTFSETGETQRVQFDHGHDSFVGSSPLGPIDVLREDNFGAYYEVPLLDTDYNRDRILPMLSSKLMNGETRGVSLLGASFRFRVIQDSWNEEPGVSDYNPAGLPERTIKEVRCYEFGPVVFPAYEGATAGVRSLTDHYLDQVRELRSSRSNGSPAGSTTGQTEPPAAGARATEGSSGPDPRAVLTLAAAHRARRHTS